MYNVIDYLEKAQEIYKDKIAIIEEEKKISYYDLYKYSRNGGSFLIDQNINKDLVVVFMDKKIDTLVAFFSVIYSGSFYTLINPELPKTRIENIVTSADIKYIITDDEHLELAETYFSDLKIMNIKDLKKYKESKEKIEKVKSEHIDLDPLYVNFTSGSTGIPKGVVIQHRSVIDFIDKFTDIFNINDKDIIANQAPFDFDVSVKDIYSALKVGATLVIIPRSYFSNPTILLDYLCKNNVTTLIWAVSALCLITTFHGLDYKVPDKVNKVIFSGEVMPIKHLKTWISHLPKAMFVNVYGPTEITCNCTYYIVDKNKDYDKLPIGKAFPNERVIIIDEDENIINEKNKVGQICVIGTCLGLGYYNNLEQTNKSFRYNSNQNKYKELIYYTGDLAYYNEDNDLVFNGRSDFQIKHLGHRIELEEIDRMIMSCKDVIRCCTIYDEEKSKLYGFYIGNIDKSDLKKYLKEKLPIYMVPTVLVCLDDFPLNKNGKIDRKKLLEMRNAVNV